MTLTEHDRNNALLVENLQEYLLARDLTPLRIPDNVLPMTTTKVRKDIYQGITDRITALSLSENKLIWRKTWKATDGGSMYPRSVATGKLYRGINPWLLWGSALENGYQSSYWATYDQWATQAKAVKEGKRWVHPEGLDFGVRKGEKATKIVFWTKLSKEVIDEVTGKKSTKRFFILREFSVFNQDQVHQVSLPKKFQPTEVDDQPVFNPIEEAEAIAAGYTEVPIGYGGDRAYYSPGGDRIQMPERIAFTTPEEYYSTLFHEMGHSTGHQSRLARPDLMEMHRFGDESYSKEELVAEMTAAMLAGMAGIENVTINNSAAYLQGWLSKLQSEPKLLVQAAAQAQKAADWILGIKWSDKPEEGASNDAEAAEGAAREEVLV
jgi:antirestriction protein ArdC